MLKIIRSERSTTTHLDLVGVVDEKTVFGDFPSATKLVQVRCQGISRINSMGIKVWKESWTAVRSKGTRLEFSEISPSLVFSLGTIRDLIPLNEISSVCAPLLCGSCGKEAIVVLSRADLKEAYNNPPKIPCAKCGGTCEFDDDPKEYFSFLKG